MAGIFLDNGQVQALQIWLNGSTSDVMYLGLMTEGQLNSDNVTTTALQIGSGITEITGTGYTRQEIAQTWTIATPTATGTQESFTVGAGGWSDVRGYFICQTLNGNDAVWCESFPEGNQGDKAATAILTVTPKFEFRTLGE